ncbi:Uma2 family endonuclease [Actinomadura fulvescens]|uniref:Putative restriction endonuclease domain-containing protein n=1 Tax=Actinomadura fulvescens TaxID=46160 RepID=A0ABN3PCC7_9ACTN
MGETFPEVTLDLYLSMPEDLASRIEVEDGRIIHCEPPSPSHNRIQRNLVVALLDLAEKHGRASRPCLDVNSGLDVLFAETPRFHYRRPDAIVYRCVPRDRGGERKDKPTAADVMIAVEVVSSATVTEDLDTKRELYAKAGIPHYWIIRMAGDDGVAVSVERLSLSADQTYVSGGVSLRGKDLLAVDVVDPFRMAVTWEQLDRGFPSARSN